MQPAKSETVRPKTATVNDIGSFERPKNEPRIDPAKRVANEDYFKTLKDLKTINGPAKQSEKMIARTRFDQQSVHAGDDGEDEAVAQSSTNPKTRQYVDTNLDPAEVIAKIQLPPSTMYLIDKVVRAKALKGPIGIDNSEVINLEIEKDVEKRNRYLANLIKKPKSEVSEIDEGDESDEQDEGTKENKANEKLLKRLYKAAERDIE